MLQKLVPEDCLTKESLWTEESQGLFDHGVIVVYGVHFVKVAELVPEDCLTNVRYGVD